MCSDFACPSRLFRAIDDLIVPPSCRLRLPTRHSRPRSLNSQCEKETATMVKFTCQVVSAALLAGLSYQGVDAFAGLKGKNHVSALKMVCSSVFITFIVLRFELLLPGGIKCLVKFLDSAHESFKNSFFRILYGFQI